MSNVQTVSIARLLSLISVMAIAASVASAQQQPEIPNSPSLFATSPASRVPPLLAFSGASPLVFLKNDSRDAAQSSTYVRPTFHQRFHAYLWHTYGPVTLTNIAFGSAISQADDVPPDWHQGWDAYGKRLASDMGSSAIGGTTEFALAEAFRLDTKYYPCTCKGIWPRVGHAILSSVTARSGDDGHRVFSVPNVAAPYASAFSTLAWYPQRYGVKDGFRTGNYDLLDSVGEIIALEFLSPVLRKLHHH